MNEISSIPAWNQLKRIDKDKPSEFVVFSTFYVAPDLAGNATATATIGRRDLWGRLYQKTPGHFQYRKFILNHMQALWQIKLLHKLVGLLNDGKISADDLPLKVESPKVWNKLSDLVDAND